ncbi:MAG: thioredoxin domain-containing protein [Roseiflexaceae bacterium]|nr:thioredoxin domain-containing protein [Roseiflexaceae bacterium]
MITHTNPDGTPKYTNSLIHATSPYLRQHAYNPVDWYFWGDEAFQQAKDSNRPILLSIGYHACHWCHVMEAESFEDEAIAQLMNEQFINIKVDREERPDIDGIYMTAIQAMTGGGGWPMTVFMTPDGMPFYGGTYFPPEDRYGMPSFRRVLLSVAEAYRERRSELQRAGSELVERIRDATSTRLADGQVSIATLDEAYASMHGQFDQTYGGFGRAPKFPQPMALEFLLRYTTRTGHALGAEMLTQTLRAMAEGGMYDQLGGGFHRYSVDEQWLVPHFEKMLYDNALLARTYVEAFQATGDSFFRRVAEETLDYLLREMRHPQGGFFSTQDADSLPTADSAHAEEGIFFVWTINELRGLLGPDSMAFAQIYDVTERGNFEGKNILHINRQPAEVARVLGMSVDQIEALIARSKQKLFAARARRPTPALDDKILVSWNGMAIRAFASAARAFGRDDYCAAARACATFLLAELRQTTSEGPDPIGNAPLLLRSWRDGQAGTTPAFLEDYALLADGLLALYEATFEDRWLLEARTLADTILARFWDATINGFYDTADTHEVLIVRPRDTGDNATPCGNSVAADVLLRLALIFDQPVYRERAEQVLGSMVPFMERYPTGFGRYLCAAEFARSTPYEVVLVGNPESVDTQAMLMVLFQTFLPNKVVLLQRPDVEPALQTPLLDGRTQINGQATAYVCRNYVCRLPVTDPTALQAELGLIPSG